jgi:uncharacterized protein (DUF433 family)
MSETLRPIERRILAMRDAGESVATIAGRLRRSPEHVERIITWTELPRTGPASRRSSRARERRVLALRAEGETYDQIAARFGRGAGYIKQVEGLAHYRLALELLG